MRDERRRGVSYSLHYHLHITLSHHPPLLSHSLTLHTHTQRERNDTHPLSHAHSTHTCRWPHTPFTITPSHYSSFSPFTSFSAASTDHSLVLRRIWQHTSSERIYRALGINRALENPQTVDIRYTLHESNESKVRNRRWRTISKEQK